MADTTTREALAALMMKHGFATGHGDTHADLIAEFDWQLAELRAAFTRAIAAAGDGT